MADGWYKAPSHDDLEGFYRRHEEMCFILEKPFILVDELDSNGIKWAYDSVAENGSHRIKFIK